MAKNLRISFLLVSTAFLSFMHSLSIPTFAADSPTDKIVSIAFTDTSGKSYSKESLSKNKATVFFFVSTECPISNIYTPRMIAISQDYASRGVACFLVDSNDEDTPARFKNYTAERKYPFASVKDSGTKLADLLHAQTTPEAVIIDTSGEFRYLGRIDDNQDKTKVARQDVREALDAVLAGKPVSRTRTLPFGCAIFRDKSAPASATKAAITYTRDIAPILNANCVICHRSGEVAPFSLETYPQARTWASAIKAYTARHIMPPWKPVAGWGDFHEARALSTAQLSAIASWADHGAPFGERKDLPTPPKFDTPGQWTLGTPDMVLSPPRPYHLAAESPDVYRNYVLPADFKEDRMLCATAFQPGNRAIVHHIVTYIDTSGIAEKLDGHDSEPGYSVPGTSIGVLDAAWGDVWVPGSAPRRLPPGIGVKIPKGAKLVMQVHYHCDGKPETDLSKMALYFSKVPVQHQLETFPIGSMRFHLAPGDSHAVVKNTMGLFSGGLPQAVKLWSIFPHMHMLGRDMKVYAVLPDGTKKQLIWINDWDFNWQATYYYKEPILLPKGTKVYLEAVYDNSAQNPRQTSQPPKAVHFGEQTTDEMCFAFMGLTFVDSQSVSRPNALHLSRKQ